MSTTRQGRARQSNLTKMEMKVGLALALAMALLGALMAMSVGSTIDRIAHWLDPDAKALMLQEEAKTLGARIATQKAGMWAGAALRWVAVASLAGAAAAGIAWVWRAGRRAYAKDGLYPVIEAPHGDYYDPNRDNAGAHLALAAGALSVQEEQAKAALQIDNLTVKQAGMPQAQALGSDEDTGGDPGLRDVYHLSELATDYSIDRLVLGVGAAGAVTASIHDLMHLLGVGASGWGKSVLLSALAVQFAQAPEPLEVVAVDVSGSAFNVLHDWDRLRYPIARTPGDAVKALGAVSKEIDRRRELYLEYPLADNLPRYNDLASDPLTPWVVMIDEGTALLNHDAVGDPLRDVVQTARQYGIYAMLTGQSAKASVIDTATRDNFSSRVCFHTNSKRSVSVVLDASLDPPSVKGRALVSLNGRQVEELQIPYVGRADLLRVIESGGPRFDAIPDAPAPDITTAQVIEDDPELPDPERIRLLHGQGVSLREIGRRVYGYPGGAAYERVKAALEE